VKIKKKKQELTEVTGFKLKTKHTNDEIRLDKQQENKLKKN